MDELDQKIVSLLRVDGRLTKLEIARRLGVTETTVRKRINRLIEDDVINIVALTNPHKFGRRLDAYIGIAVAAGQLQDAARRLTEMVEVRYAGLSTGGYNIMLVASFTSQDHLADFLTARLAEIPGVIRADTFQIIRVIKRAYEFPRMASNGHSDTEPNLT